MTLESAMVQDTISGGSMLASRRHAYSIEWLGVAGRPSALLLARRVRRRWPGTGQVVAPVGQSADEDDGRDDERQTETGDPDVCARGRQVADDLSPQARGHHEVP